MAEFILYMPWMAYSYYLVYRNRVAATEYWPVFFAFMLMGIVITDLLLQKKSAVYSVTSYLIGILPLGIAAPVVMRRWGVLSVALFCLFSLVSYARGVSFARCSFKNVYGRSKFIGGLAVLFIAYGTSVLYRDFNWFEGTVIGLAVVFVVLSMALLNQLQLLNMFELMNAESMASHKDVRLRNLLFSLMCSGFIVLIFWFKYVVRLLSAIAQYAGHAVRYIVTLALRWLITWLNKSHSSHVDNTPHVSESINMLQGKDPSHWVAIIKAILEYILYAVTVVIIAALVYAVVRAVLRWFFAFVTAYMHREDEERNFIFSWDDVLVEQAKKLRHSVSRHIKRLRRRFETPVEYLRFLYREAVYHMAMKDGDNRCGINASFTPDEIHRNIKRVFPWVDPDFENLTALYKRARYSNCAITDESVKEAKRYRDKLVKSRDK